MLLSSNTEEKVYQKVYIDCSATLTVISGPQFPTVSWPGLGGHQKLG